MPVTIKANSGGGSVTLDAGTTSTDTTLTLPSTTGTVINTAPGTSGNVLTSNGTVWTSAAPSFGVATAVGQVPFSTDGSTFTATQKIVAGTAVASTSGTSITFSSIPSWAKRVTVMFTGVSTNGSSNVTVRIGSGSVQTTGYTGAGMEVVSANQVGGLNLSSGFTIRSQGGASDVYNGAYILSYFGSNTWVCTATIGLSSTIRGMIVGGYVALSGALDRVSITTEGGTDTFDAGSINILYE